MGLFVKSVFYLLMILAMIVALNQSVMILPELSDDYVDMVLASRAGAMARDQPATAAAGVIVLEATRAKQLVEQSLTANNEDPTRFEIFVVNNAPVLFRWRGEEHFFNTNGIAVGLEFNGNPILKTEEVRLD